MASTNAAKCMTKNDDEGNNMIAVQSKAQPGFEAWPNNSKLVSGGELSEMSKLILTEGPLKGRHVLTLEPITSFTFLALPPEIRGIIYGYLLDKSHPTKMSTLVCQQKNRRPVVDGFTSKASTKHLGLKWDKDFAKWLNYEPNNFALLRVCKQISAETAPIAYGNNSFEFKTTSDSKVFLETIGPMRKYLRDISLPGKASYTGGKGQATFDLLTPAVNIRPPYSGREHSFHHDRPYDHLQSKSTGQPMRVPSEVHGRRQKLYEGIAQVAASKGCSA